MSGPPRVEQAANLAEELVTVSQKCDLNVNKLKRQKVRNSRFKNDTRSLTVSYAAVTGSSRGVLPDDSSTATRITFFNS